MTEKTQIEAGGVSGSTVAPQPPKAEVGGVLTDTATAPAEPGVVGQPPLTDAGLTDAGPIPGPQPQEAGEETGPGESWVRTLARHPAQLGVVGGFIVFVLVIGLVALLGSPSSTGGRPLWGTAFGPPVTTPQSGSGAGSGAGAGAGAASSGSALSAPAPVVASASGSPVSGASGAGAGTPGSHPAAPSSPAPSSNPQGSPSPGPSSSSSPPPPAVGPCTPNDVTIVTTTDAPAYSPGATVTAETELVDNVACDYTPVAAGPYSCPTTIVFTNSSGQQVYPVQGQGEQCAPLDGGYLTPGATRTVTVKWPQQGAITTSPTQPSADQYYAIGQWTWSSAGAGAPGPFQASAASPPFVVSS